MDVTEAPGRQSFRMALDAAAAIAALSPSSHNSQPWALARLSSAGARRSAGALLGLDGGGREHLALAVDRTRQLDALPAHAVEMVLSCGAYWQVLIDALAAAGWVLDASCGEPGPLGDGRQLCGGWPPTWSPLAVAAFRPGGGDDAALAELRRLATARRTNRAAYLDAVPFPDVLARLAGDPAGPGTEVRHLTGPDERAAFADLVARHAGRDYSHDAAWRETHAFLRWSRADAAARGDGLLLGEPAGLLAGPRQRVSRLALAPASMRVLRHVGYAGVLGRRLAGTVRSTPVIVALSVPGPEPDDRCLLDAGGRLVRYWLAATGAGLALHPISVLVQHEDVRRQLEDRLGLPGRVVFVSRLGRPAVGVPPAPRRPAAAGYGTC